MTAEPTYEELLQRVKELEQTQTERTLIEETLRKSEEKYKLLAEHSADIIYKLNIETEQYSYISPSIKRVLGYTAEEGLSLTSQDTVTTESYIKQRDRLFEAISNHQMDPAVLELEAVHKDGHTLPVETHATILLDAQGSPVEILGVVRDISKRKEMQAEREKLIEHLQEALKEIKALRGILPLCSFCKRVRDDRGYWEQVDVYLQKYSLVDISHSICPKCVEKHFPGIDMNDIQ